MTPTIFAQAKLILVLQLLVTLAILAWLPGNLLKLACLLALWALTFWPITLGEAVFFLCVSVFFTFMNAMSLQQGIFQFTSPDILRMPWYELPMWGFYTLHTRRVLGGTPPAVTRSAWVLALAYAAAFGTIQDADVLLMVSGSLLVVALVIFHTREDLLYTFYMIGLGACIEFTGVLSGEWSYPGDPVGGVPLWFITLWGGVGLFLWRLALPLLVRYSAGARHPVATD